MTRRALVVGTGLDTLNWAVDTADCGRTLYILQRRRLAVHLAIEREEWRSGGVCGRRRRLPDGESEKGSGGGNDCVVHTRSIGYLGP